jgi:transcriptional regulator with XRE-family HTH domain
MRLQRGWSQRELAHRAGCDPAHINRIESDGGAPSLPMAVHLAETLGESPLRLVALLVAAYQRPSTPRLDVWDRLALACQEGYPSVPRGTPGHAASQVGLPARPIHPHLTV